MHAHCRRQLHLWLTEADHAFVCARAAESESTLGAVIRSLIREARRTAERVQQSGDEPISASLPVSRPTRQPI